MNKNTRSLLHLEADFENIRSLEKSQKKFVDKLKDLEKENSYLAKWYAFSKKGDEVYPSQGLVKTPYDYLDYQLPQMLPQDLMVETLRVRAYFLTMFNHPYRMHFLDKVNQGKFIPPPTIKVKPLDQAIKNGLSLAIGDIGASIIGSQNERIRRTDRYAQGPFVKLGKQARSIFVGSSSPDVWNTAAAIATMAASHSLAALPRNGLLYNLNRQADLAEEVFVWLKYIKTEILKDNPDAGKIVKLWKKNVMGTLEGSSKKALKRAEVLFDKGIRTFRIYSPEPGTGPLETTKALRKKYGSKIEIFASFVIDVTQAKELEQAGANGVFVGIGGGGRCITGVRSGSAIDWPELVYKLRGEIGIPVIVEGGASDHISTALLLGASGISVSRIASGGTIESPGGALFFSDNNGKLFKPYGGEASARTKYLDGKLLPFNIPSFIEGETTKAFISFNAHTLPTMTYNLHLLTEDAILALVFRGVKTIHDLHSLDPSPLKQITTLGEFQQNTH